MRELSLKKKKINNVSHLIQYIQNTTSTYNPFKIINILSFLY